MSFEIDWRGARPTFQAQPRGPAGSEPLIRLQQDWTSWHVLSLRVRDLPPNVRTLDLWDAFHDFGNLSFINIFVDRSGIREGTGLIRFQPPPKYDFWSDKTFSIQTADGQRHSISLFIDTKRPINTMKSPLRKNVTYPRVVDLRPMSLGFGVLSDENTIMSKRIIDAAEALDQDMQLRIDLWDKRIETTFYAGNDNSQDAQATKLRFRIGFEDMTHINLMPYTEDTSALVISLDNPPRFFKQPMANLQASHSDALTWRETFTWIRATEVAGGGLPPSRVLKLSQEYPIIDMGRWTTYMFIIKNDQIHTEGFEQLKEALQDHNIETRETRFSNVPSKEIQLWKLIDGPTGTKSADALQCMLGQDESYFNLPFEVRYQLEVCVSHAYLEQHSLHAEFVKKLAEVAEKSKDRALAILEWVALKAKRVFEPMSIFTNPEAMSHTVRQKIPPYCAYARKAIITPTALYFGSPTVEISNRVIRHYSSYGDRFIRVQFTDENRQGRINPCSDKTMNDALYARVYYVLLNGIQIGDRHFEFLAFGNSQFREHGAYFFAPTPDLSCADIRKWMGKFSDIRVPAKYASRLGMCFSTTRAIKNRGLTVVGIPDVEHDGYCFTDGVGKISQFMMKMIANDLGLLYEPSVIQFRMGGCKGILAAWPNMKPYEVHIRKSQNKFPAEYMGLEIIRASKFSPASLNRQTISILSALGIESHVFCRMLDEQLANYNEAIVNPEVALDLLTRYIDDAHSTMGIAAMVHNGFQRSGDPFVNSLLHLWRSWSIKLLKEKAKIVVERGAFVFGCTDETGTLKGHTDRPPKAAGEKFTAEDIEDLPEIFLQIPNPEDRAMANPENKAPYVIMTGLCIIGRNPSLHPGDIRVVRAVDVPALHHLKDVVVFSQKGDIDVPRMCSGGDLDGDDFFVIWDKELIPPQWNAEPMSYVPPEVEERAGEVTMGDVIGFFVRYMKNDSLPTIANAHLAHADRNPDSVRSSICLELANLHSKAVDYVKTGVPAIMRKEYYPQLWPHFMEKHHLAPERTYHSGTVLGQLYDRVERVEFVPQYEMPFDSRVLKAFPENKDLLKLARQLKTEYDSAMRRIMAQFSIKTEFEIWTAFLLSKPVGFNNYQAESEMALISDALKQRFKKACEDALGGNDFKTLGPFAAAMYQVTWEEMSIALQECKQFRTVGGAQVPMRRMEPSQMPLISFPWLYQEVLGRIVSASDPSELDLNMPMPKAVINAARKSKAPQLIDLDDNDDVIYTADGVTHRGEVLELFKPEDENTAANSDDETEAPRQRVYEYQTMLTDGHEGGVANKPTDLPADDPYNIMLREELRRVESPEDIARELCETDTDSDLAEATEAQTFQRAREPTDTETPTGGESPSSTATTGFESISDIVSLLNSPVAVSDEKEHRRPFGGFKHTTKPSECSVSVHTTMRPLTNVEESKSCPPPSDGKLLAKERVADARRENGGMAEAAILNGGKTAHGNPDRLTATSREGKSDYLPGAQSSLVTPTMRPLISLEELHRQSYPSSFKQLPIRSAAATEPAFDAGAESSEEEEEVTLEIEESPYDKLERLAAIAGNEKPSEMKPSESLISISSVEDQLITLGDDESQPVQAERKLVVMNPDPFVDEDIAETEKDEPEIKRPERKLTVTNPDPVARDDVDEGEAVTREIKVLAQGKVQESSDSFDDDDTDFEDEGGSVTLDIQENAFDKLERLAGL